jgi:hypothetical protein
MLEVFTRLHLVSAGLHLADSDITALTDPPETTLARMALKLRDDFCLRNCFVEPTRARASPRDRSPAPRPFVDTLTATAHLLTSRSTARRRMLISTDVSLQQGSSFQPGQEDDR